MFIALQVACPLFLSDFNESLNFLGRFLKDALSSNFTKIRPVGATLFHADGKTRMGGRTDGRTGRQKGRQTDRHDGASSRFWQFCEGALKRAIHAKHRICLTTVYMQHTEMIKSRHGI
jgi:hypothetical protein